MSYLVEGYHSETVATAPVSERAAFIKRTYLHLLGAVVAFVAIEAYLITSGFGTELLKVLFVDRLAWIGLLVLFIAGGYAAQALARSRSGPGMQYAGLTLYVLLEALIFLPILTIATTFPQFAGKNLPLQAGIVTLAVFAGLTIAVFVSGKDFSFMGTFLWVCSFLALGYVLVAVFTGALPLGLVFCGIMVLLAAGFIIYDTSNIIHHYGTGEHVAASLNLFASVALLFWYILRIFMISSDD